MLLEAKAGPNDILFNLGCGDRRILIVADKEFNVCFVVGYEIRRNLARLALLDVRKECFVDKVRITNGDFLK